MLNLPSVWKLSELSPEHAKQIRKILECITHKELQSVSTYPYSARVDYAEAKLECVDALLPQTHGVEYISRGHNAKSPAIFYCNAGDPYLTTLMYVCGKGYKVGCWGDIVERGNYD